MLADFLLVVDFRRVTGVRGAVEPYAGLHKLRGVLVGRRHVNVETGGSALHGKRTSTWWVFNELSAVYSKSDFSK